MADQHEGKLPYLATPTGFSTWLCDEHVRAENGVVWLTPEQEAEMEMLIAKHHRYDFRMHLRKIENSTIDKVVEDHKKAEQEKRAAVQGPLTSHNGALDVVREVDLAQNGDNVRKTNGQSILQRRLASRG